MKKKSLLFLTAIFLFFSSCGDSVEDMVGDYNGAFTEGHLEFQKEESEDETLSPGDEGFSASNMLYDEYYVWENATLNLSGPPNCRSWNWVVTDPKEINADGNEKVVWIQTVDLSSERNAVGSQRFVIYIPDSGLKVGRTYRLTLTVKGLDGSEYKDSCAIVVYQHIYNW